MWSIHALNRDFPSNNYSTAYPWYNSSCHYQSPIGAQQQLNAWVNGVRLNHFLRSGDYRRSIGLYIEATARHLMIGLWRESQTNFYFQPCSPRVIATALCGEIRKVITHCWRTHLHTGIRLISSPWGDIDIRWRVARPAREWRYFQILVTPLLLLFNLFCLPSWRVAVNTALAH